MKNAHHDTKRPFVFMNAPRLRKRPRADDGHSNTVAPDHIAAGTDRNLDFTISGRLHIFFPTANQNVGIDTTRLTSLKTKSR